MERYRWKLGKKGDKLVDKFHCECGCVISNTCGSEGELFIDYEYYRDKADSLGIFECPKCGNIMIDGDDKIISYKPVSGIYNKILHDKEYIKYD